MSTKVETYVERAKRLKLDPTEACIACGGIVQRVLLDGHKFCTNHTDWERAACIRCDSCGYEVGLVCSVSTIEGAT